MNFKTRKYHIDNAIQILTGGAAAGMLALILAILA